MSEYASKWAQPSLGALVQGVFLGALALAYLSHDSNALTLMYGAVIANATSVIQFYFGSSRGSQAKDETIARAANANAEPQAPPVAIAVNNPEPKP